MYFVVSGQDLQFLTVGTWERGGDLRAKRLSTPPEGYLAAIHQALTEWSLALASFEGVIVVTGPGSFTASRVSVTIASALAYCASIPVVGVENPRLLSLEELLSQSALRASEHLVPSYDRPAHITQPRGDKRVAEPCQT